MTRRQFVKLTGATAASALWLPPLFAAQPARKRIVIHGERQVTSLGYHNRRETEHVSMVDAGLVGQNPATFERVPVLAEELPSVKKGTWKIDMQKKTMITVYKLRPNLKWHDGKPYTSKDFEFGWQIAKHPEFPMPDRLVPEMISKIETPDDRTLVIHWNDLYNEAYAIQYTHVRAFPRHLLLDAFQAGDMKAFANLPYWNKNFVGAGAFKVVEWDQGSRMELEAFNDFALGRPKIDRITYKTVEDTNTNLAAVHGRRGRSLHAQHDLLRRRDDFARSMGKAGQRQGVDQPGVVDLAQPQPRQSMVQRRQSAARLASCHRPRRHGAKPFQRREGGFASAAVARAQGQQQSAGGVDDL